jgi:hypothetical protein
VPTHFRGDENTMKKVKQNAIVDLLAVISFIPLFISGMVLFRFWPSFGGGYHGGRNPEFVTQVLGLSHQNWVFIHDWSSLIFTLLVVLHLILHWRFMKNIGKYLSDRPVKKTEEE